MSPVYADVNQLINEQSKLKVIKIYLYILLLLKIITHPLTFYDLEFKGNWFYLTSFCYPVSCNPHSPSVCLWQHLVICCHQQGHHGHAVCQRGALDSGDKIWCSLGLNIFLRPFNRCLAHSVWLSLPLVEILDN